MNKAAIGLMTGMALGFAGWFGGFVAFLLVGSLGALEGIGRRNRADRPATSVDQGATVTAGAPDAPADLGALDPGDSGLSSSSPVSSATEDATPGATAAAGRPRRLVFRPPPAGGRGALAISERTRNRIAAQAAAEAIQQAVEVPVAGRPGAVVRVRRGRAHVRLNIALPYPVDIGGLCADVRRSVAARCLELTGTAVRRVDVTVDRLERAEGERGVGDERGAGERAGGERESVDDSRRTASARPGDSANSPSGEPVSLRKALG